MSNLNPDVQASKNCQHSDGFQSIPKDLTKSYSCFNCETGTLELSPVWVCNHCGLVMEYDPEPPLPPEEKDEMTILLETLGEIDRDYRNYRKLFDEATKNCRIEEASKYHDILLQLDNDRVGVFNDCHAEAARCRL